MMRPAAPAQPDARIRRILADLTIIKLWCRNVAGDLRDDHEVEYILGRIAQIEEQLARLAEYGM
jgi:hypothetical protein